jgi:hypothetical protein
MPCHLPQAQDALEAPRLAELGYRVAAWHYELRADCFGGRESGSAGRGGWSKMSDTPLAREREAIERVRARLEALVRAPPIQNVSGLSQGLAAHLAAGWRRWGGCAGNKWHYERVYSPDGIVFSGGLPWLSRAT